MSLRRRGKCLSILLARWNILIKFSLLCSTLAKCMWMGVPIRKHTWNTVSPTWEQTLVGKDANFRAKNTKKIRKKYKISYWPPRDTPPANSAVCTSQGTSHMCPLPPLTTISLDSIYFYIKIYFPLSDIFPSSIFYIERYFLLDSFIGLYKQTNWASISESSNWKLNAWKMVSSCHLFFLFIIII